MDDSEKKISALTNLQKYYNELRFKIQPLIRVPFDHSLYDCQRNAAKAVDEVKNDPGEIGRLQVDADQNMWEYQKIKLLCKEMDRDIAKKQKQVATLILAERRELEKHKDQIIADA